MHWHTSVGDYLVSSEGVVREHTSSAIVITMPRKECCGCHSSYNGSCTNCKCVKAKKACTNCYVSRDGKCENRYGAPEVVIEAVDQFVCPYPTCTEGRGGRAVALKSQSLLRTHVGTHLLTGFVPSDAWLLSTESRVCPSCSVAITNMTLNCWDCRSSFTPSEVPRAVGLPPLQRNHVVQLSLGVTPGPWNVGLPFVPEHCNNFLSMSNNIVDKEINSSCNSPKSNISNNNNSINESIVLGGVAGCPVVGDCVVVCGVDGGVGCGFGGNINTNNSSDSNINTNSRDSNSSDISTNNSSSDINISNNSDININSSNSSGSNSVSTSSSSSVKEKEKEEVKEKSKEKEGGEKEVGSKEEKAKEKMKAEKEVAKEKVGEAVKVKVVEKREMKMEQKKEKEEKVGREMKLEAKELGSSEEGEEDEKAPRRTRRPMHNPGSKGVNPPPQSTLGKKPVIDQRAAPSGGSARVADGPPGVPGVERPRLNVPLMDICRTSVPMVKRIPNRCKGSFAQV